MRIDPARMVKLGLFFCLALTAWKGFMKLPEVYPVLDAKHFYRGLINDGENSLIMKERHFDFNYQTGKALELRWNEMRAGAPAEGELATLDRVERAIRKTASKDARNADYVLLAEEKLARARRLQAEGWSMGWGTCPSSGNVGGGQ